jgi:glycosyltransferase involved in cell wall biosynthesis
LPANHSECGAIGDLIENGSNGLLVEPRSAPAIAAAIHRLASDRGALERKGAAARAAITARYSIGRLAAELCGVYEDLCARAARQRIARARPEGR